MLYSLGEINDHEFEDYRSIERISIPETQPTQRKKRKLKKFADSENQGAPKNKQNTISQPQREKQKGLIFDFFKKVKKEKNSFSKGTKTG